MALFFICVFAGLSLLLSPVLLNVRCRFRLEACEQSLYVYVGIGLFFGLAELPVEVWLFWLGQPEFRIALAKKRAPTAKRKKKPRDEALRQARRKFASGLVRSLLRDLRWIRVTRARVLFAYGNGRDAAQSVLAAGAARLACNTALAVAGTPKDACDAHIAPIFNIDVFCLNLEGIFQLRSRKIIGIAAKQLREYFKLRKRGGKNNASDRKYHAHHNGAA